MISDCSTFSAKCFVKHAFLRGSLVHCAGVVSPPAEARRNHQDYYSVFHKTPNRKKFSEQEWEDSKAHWTRQAVSDLVSSPEFADWVIDHADRIRVVSSESSEEAVGSDSDSTEEVTAKSSNRISPFSFW